MLRIPRNIKLQNVDKGDTYYCVSIKPVGQQRFNIFTFANNHYQAMENAWALFNFCDIDPLWNVSKVD